MTPSRREFIKFVVAGSVALLSTLRFWPRRIGNRHRRRSFTVNTSKSATRFATGIRSNTRAPPAKPISLSWEEASPVFPPLISSGARIGCFLRKNLKFGGNARQEELSAIR